MKRIGASEARKHLPHPLDRAARLVPETRVRDRAKAAAARIIERRRHIECAPLADLLATMHEGHRH
ncbi:MAG: hypothetical protein OXO52_10930 [Rhodospirillales bacterium]|nr:hypothetical protein [Rhodospirillales bacterium]MDE0378461.1 hypothetical protein [Rhodospirillales bacterium]